jgi:hypothetical protein
MNTEMEMKLIEMRAQHEMEIQKKRADMEIEILKIHQQIQELLKHQMFLDERKKKITKIREKYEHKMVCD